jgi:hypothetical protein
VILDTNGNIFGGYTWKTWYSRIWNGESGDSDNRWEEDAFQTGFLFTLKNPHKVKARKFKLKRESKNHALLFCSTKGPCFGKDILISDNCNTGDVNRTHLGVVYVNDAGIDGKTFLVGSEVFQVQEIEVFEFKLVLISRVW